MFDNLDPRTLYVALEITAQAWVGEGRVLAAELVEYDSDDQEIGRQELTFSGDPYYPQASVLQTEIDAVNDRRRKRR